jgi:hypothetical protein
MKATVRATLAIPLILAFLSLGLSASGAPAAKTGPGALTADGVRLEQAPVIDGTLEPSVWERAFVIEDFTQYEPQEGGRPSERTVAYVAYDHKAVYIAVRCFDADPKGIRACLTQRDKVMGDDEVSIYLDTFNDKKRAFVFQVNPCGVQSDGIYTEPTGRSGRGGGTGFDRIDRSWDTFFRAAASVDGAGYTVEMAIPFKSLRFPNAPSQTWGLLIMRSIRRKSEDVTWPPRSRNVNGLLVQAGRLTIEGEIEKGRNLEVMPVVTGAKTTGEKIDPRAGLNLKYGLTSNLTADATVNPDFSQVEADMPQVDVNQRYPLYYPEKRPFFLEGKDFYETPLELLYTRSMLEPRWGLKFSGKTGRTALGFMSVLDGNTPDISFPGAEFPIVGEIAPRGLFNVLRVRRDLFSESSIGFILTDKEMGYEGESLTRNHNRIAAIDGLFKFARLYRLSFQLAGSQSRVGDSETGFAPALALNLSRQSRHLRMSVDWTSIHPDFEAASGFLRRKDIHSLNTRISYSFLPQNKTVISVTPSVNYRRVYDFTRTLTDEEKEFSLMISGWGQSFFWMNYQDSFERYNGVDFKTRDWRFNLSAEPLAWLSGRISRGFGDGIYYSDAPYLGYKSNWSAMVTLKPLSNLRFFTSFTNSEFFEGRGGERVYAVNIISERISYQISRPLSLRLITDWNDYYRKLYLSFLLSYQLNPGTVFYVGLDDSRERDAAGFLQSTGRYIFVKFSYWWRA